MSANGTPAEKATVRAKVHAKYPDIGEKREGMQHAVARAASKADKMYGRKHLKRG